MRIGKTELVDALAKKLDKSKKEVSGIVDAVFDEISESLAKGDEVALIGFGTFEVRERAARTGTHPQTKEPLNIPSKKAPAFKAGKALKAAVDK